MAGDRTMFSRHNREATNELAVVMTTCPSPTLDSTWEQGYWGRRDTKGRRDTERRRDTEGRTNTKGGGHDVPPPADEFLVLVAAGRGSHFLYRCGPCYRAGPTPNVFV